MDFLDWLSWNFVFPLFFFATPTGILFLPRMCYDGWIRVHRTQNLEGLVVYPVYFWLNTQTNSGHVVVDQTGFWPIGRKCGDGQISDRPTDQICGRRTISSPLIFWTSFLLDLDSPHWGKTLKPNLLCLFEVLPPICTVFVVYRQLCTFVYFCPSELRS